MSEPTIYPVPTRVNAGSPSSIHDIASFQAISARATNDPSAFWLDIARERITWATPPTVGLEGGYRTVAEKPFTWFADGRLNATVSCIDRHLATRGDKTAILWEGDQPGDNRRLSYRELHAEVCRVAHGLAALGVTKGDRVIIYMGMVPEAAIAMLACARLGAIHSAVFGGFSAGSVRGRVDDLGARWVITQDEGMRGGRPIPLKRVVDDALSAPGHDIQRVVVYQHTRAQVAMVAGRDLTWAELTTGQPTAHDPVIVEAEHPLYILYTSGSTGKPKGLVHTTGGYLTFAAYTHQVVFDLREDDVYACVADIGWVTGHSYIVYGPLANGATTLMFESIPTYPDAGRYWDMVERLKITVFYGAPTALRMLAAQGDEFVKRYDRSSLRVLGSVGEPINPDAWRWYYNVVGDGRCNICDTWWQTETGGMLISPIAPVTATKPGSATLPLPGVLPALLTPEGDIVRGPGEGLLCLAFPWPGQARTLWGDHARYIANYFARFPGFYLSGDGARRDADGYYWVTGRVDDVINVAGHRIGTAEIESAIATVTEVGEVAVVGYPHELKGQGVYAYVVLQPGVVPNAELETKMNAACRTLIGAHARVDAFQYVPGLPKTRSAKVMRRILRKIAEGTPEQLGDITTLADPSVVQAIVAGAEAVLAKH